RGGQAVPTANSTAVEAYSSQLSSIVLVRTRACNPLEEQSMSEQQPSMSSVDPASKDDYIYNRLLKERIIWLGSEVRDDNANAICSQMLLLSAEDPEQDIYHYINSPGGSVTAGMAIYDTMQFIPNDVVTVA